MAQNEPFFAGDSEIDQLFKVFQVLGTPNDSKWPGVSSLPDYKATFPKWNTKDLGKYATNLDKNGLELLA